MTDTSKLNAEASAIATSSARVRAFAIDSAQATVDLNARLAKLEQQVAALTPASKPTGFPRQGISVPLYNLVPHKAQFLSLCKELANGHPFAVRTDWWHGDANWTTLVADAAGFGLTVLPLHGFAWGASDAPSLSAYVQGAAEASKLTGWLNLLNEPNLNHWTPQTAAQYVSAAYDAARVANPNVKVIGPDIAVRDNSVAESTAALQWLKDFKAAGGKVDVLAANLYDVPPKGLWAVVDQLKAVYPGLPLFSLESGYWDSANVMYAESVINSAMDARDHGTVDSVLVYSLRDDASPGGFGLLDSAGVKRPAFAALQARAAS